MLNLTIVSVTMLQPNKYIVINLCPEKWFHDGFLFLASKFNLLLAFLHKPSTWPRKLCILLIFTPNSFSWLLFFYYRVLAMSYVLTVKWFSSLLLLIWSSENHLKKLWDGSCKDITKSSILSPAGKMELLSA